MATDNLKDLELMADSLARMGDMETLGRVIDAIAVMVKRKNKSRIQANVQPDGSPMPRRKMSRKGNSHIAFVYKNPTTGVTLVRNLKNYRHFGPYIKGFDRTRGAIRSFRISRIVRFISIDKSKVVVRKTPQKMFKNIIKDKWFKLKTSPKSATIEFAGAAGHVAAIHHYGEKDRPNPKAKEIRYPERQLLAVTPQDEKDMLDILIEELTKGL
ncbi:phage virion morphogenesis protein [Aeromonas jandaei]